MQPELKESLLKRPGIKKQYDQFNSSLLYRPGTAERYLQRVAAPDPNPTDSEVDLGGLKEPENLQVLITAIFAGTDQALSSAQVCATVPGLPPRSLSAAVRRLSHMGLLIQCGSTSPKRYRLASLEEMWLSQRLLRTTEHWAILDLLQNAPKPLNQTHVAMRLNLPPATVTKCLRELEQEGAIKRHSVAGGKKYVWSCCDD